MKKYIKLLVENLFDDDIFDIDNASDDLMDFSRKDFENDVINILCQNTKYHQIMPEDKEDGLTTILYDPDDLNKLYAGLTATYKSLYLGPRKRKKYNVGYFYKYTIVFNDDGTISLYVKNYTRDNKCVISS